MNFCRRYGFPEEVEDHAVDWALVGENPWNDQEGAVEYHFVYLDNLALWEKGLNHASVNEYSADDEVADHDVVV